MEARLTVLGFLSQVAQQKTVASDMELRRANAALAAAQEQAGAAGRSASNWERQAMESQRDVREMAAAARATDAAARALEGKLEGAGRRLAAFSRRVAFAEERLQVRTIFTLHPSQQLTRIASIKGTNGRVAWFLLDFISSCFLWRSIQDVVIRDRAATSGR